MRFRGLAVLAPAVCAGLACLGQVQSPPNLPPLQGGGNGVMSRVIDGVTHTVTLSTQGTPPLPGSIAFTGAPYSGDEVEENVRTLADGTELTSRRLNNRTYRDRQGRLRVERFPQNADPESEPPAGSISIQDPVANVQYLLEVRLRVARRWDMSKIPTPDTMFLAPIGISHGEGLPPSPPPRSMPADYRPPQPPTRPPGPPPPGAIPRPPDAPTMKSEHLGTQVIEGVTVEGTRRTTTSPAGAEGSDRPIVRVTEQWTSAELRATVLSISKDPRLGVTTRRLIHLSREEPDPSLFQPPPDYRIEDQQISVTINHQVRN